MQAWAVPPGNPEALVSAIRTLAGDHEMCRKLGKNGRNIVETQFSRDELADKFATLLESMRS